MADINLAAFNVDPKTIQGINRFGFNKGVDFSITPTSKPKSALERYRGDYQANLNRLLSLLNNKDNSGIGAAILAGNLGQDPSSLEAQSELRRQEMENRFKLEKEALALAEETAIRKQGRQFTMDQASRLFESIPRAFGAIPFEATQEVTANIANLVSPRNLNPQPQLQPAAFSMPARQYFR